MLTNLAASTAVQTLVIENFVLTTVIEQAFIKKAEKEKKRKETEHRNIFIDCAESAKV